MVPYTFPQNGEHEIQIRLRRDRDEKVEAWANPRSRTAAGSGARAVFTVKPCSARPDFLTPTTFTKSRPASQTRVPVGAGPRHRRGISEETVGSAGNPRQPYQAHFNSYRHPRSSRRFTRSRSLGRMALKVRATRQPAAEFLCRARRVSCGSDAAPGRFSRRWRERFIDARDGCRPARRWRLRTARGEEISTPALKAVSAVLVSPQFLFRVEQIPGPQGHHGVSRQRLALASASVFSEQYSGRGLLTTAVAGLHEPAVLERQVRRMLADAR